MSLLRGLMTTDQGGGLLREMVQEIIPPLSYSYHKGNSGRIGVIGGCKEYTGAPYFAAISALKVGSDLSHVICTQSAAPVIKSYSPELIVHPILDTETGLSEVAKWLPALHSLVIGPGLGREPDMMDRMKTIFENAKALEKPLVVDADGLYLLSLEPALIQAYTKAILTPNVVEFARLFEKVIGKKPEPESEAVQNVIQLSETLGNITIVMKGQRDIISDGKEVVVCTGEGSPRRCGGQGDLLSGSMGTFNYWAHQAAEKSDNELLKKYGPTLCAAYAACLLTRECSRRAFASHRRAMTTSDMIPQILPSFETLYSNL